MAAWRLIVPNIEKSVFEAYWYGYGSVVSVSEGEIPDRRTGAGTFTYVIDYGDDEYRCRYQDGRFGSGLYYSKVEEV